MLYRRFGYLQSRVLSDKQDQLRELEEELAEFDEELWQEQNTFTQTRTLITDDDLHERREALMEKISNAYCAYCETLGILMLIMNC